MGKRTVFADSDDEGVADGKAHIETTAQQQLKRHRADQQHHLAQAVGAGTPPKAQEATKGKKKNKKKNKQKPQGRAGDPFPAQQLPAAVSKLSSTAATAAKGKGTRSALSAGGDAAAAACGLTFSASELPFTVDAADHCETPLIAYEHLALLLGELARCTPQKHQQRNRGQSATPAPTPPSPGLRVYDPYFCAGSVKRHLAALGFPNVSNQPRDCYADWAAGASAAPEAHEWDVLVTNPPFSGDHMDRLFAHLGQLCQQQQAWAVLVPSFVHKKPYFEAAMGGRGRAASRTPLFLVPHKRYVFLPPPGAREKKASDTHAKSSAFVTLWIVWGGTQAVTDTLARTAQRRLANACHVARTRSQLRDMRRTKK
eukprot:m.103116 g.103116  ORF g.103116 m.103116 type:complete len:370 (+) comp15559_c0_seq1:91-1200(+)